MAKRKKISEKTSKKIFAKTGVKVNSLNMPHLQLRGGIRL